jgi:uncharacterized protein YciU (UPF0263 family)
MKDKQEVDLAVDRVKILLITKASQENDKAQDVFQKEMMCKGWGLRFIHLVVWRAMISIKIDRCYNPNNQQ